MIKHRIHLFGMLLFLLSIQLAMGQTLVGPSNGSFESPFANNVTITDDDCPSFSNFCPSPPVLNTICAAPESYLTWMRSHGTPAFIVPSSNPNAIGNPKDGSQYVSMWANRNGTGEGVFTNFTFNPNQTYLICFSIRRHWGKAEDGTINDDPIPSEAANGNWHFRAVLDIENHQLQESTVFDNCGEFPPIPPDVLYHTLKEGDYVGVTNSNYYWEEISIVFDPGSVNYSQLWFLPTVSDNFGAQTFLDVDDVKIYTCPFIPTHTFSDPGQTIPMFAQANNLVNIGTSFGSSSSGQVENDPNVGSYIISGNTIVFKENTRISVNSNGGFYAKIEECDLRNVPCYPRKGDRIGSEQLSPILNPLALTVYPNPVGKEDKIFVEMETPYTGKVLVEIYDLQGRAYIQKHMAKEGKGVFKQKLDISSLPAGLYLVRATYGTEVMTSKLSVTE